MFITPDHNPIVIKALAQNRLFKNASTQALAELCADGVFISYDAEEVIITEGDTKKEAFVVLSGEVRISRDDFMMARFGPGTLFGEFSMMTGAPYTASAETLTPVEVYKITADGFDAAIKNNPDFALEVIRNLALRLRRHL